MATLEDARPVSPDPDDSNMGIDAMQEDVIPMMTDEPDQTVPRTDLQSNPEAMEMEEPTVGSVLPGSPRPPRPPILPIRKDSKGPDEPVGDAPHTEIEGNPDIVRIENEEPETYRTVLPGSPRLPRPPRSPIPLKPKDSDVPDVSVSTVPHTGIKANPDIARMDIEELIPVRTALLGSPRLPRPPLSPTPLKQKDSDAPDESVSDIPQIEIKDSPDLVEMEIKEPGSVLTALPSSPLPPRPPRSPMLMKLKGSDPPDESVSGDKKESSDEKAEGEQPKRKRSVTFQDVEVIELPMVAGENHPSQFLLDENDSDAESVEAFAPERLHDQADSAAITLAWEAQARIKVDVDTYEAEKAKKKSGVRKKLKRMSRAVRKRILRNIGVETSDIESEDERRSSKRPKKKKKKKKKKDKEEKREKKERKEREKREKKERKERERKEKKSKMRFFTKSPTKVDRFLDDQALTQAVGQPPLVSPMKDNAPGVPARRNSLDNGGSAGEYVVPLGAPQGEIDQSYQPAGTSSYDIRTGHHRPQHESLSYDISSSMDPARYSPDGSHDKRTKSRRTSLGHVTNAVAVLAKQPVKLAKQPVKLAKYTTKKVRRTVGRARSRGRGASDDESSGNDFESVPMPPLYDADSGHHIDYDEQPGRLPRHHMEDVIEEDRSYPTGHPIPDDLGRQDVAIDEDFHDRNRQRPQEVVPGEPASPKRQRRARRSSLEHVSNAVAVLAKQPGRLAKQPVKLAKYTSKKVRKSVGRARNRTRGTSDDESSLNDYEGTGVPMAPPVYDHRHNNTRAHHHHEPEELEKQHESGYPPDMPTHHVMSPVARKDMGSEDDISISPTVEPHEEETKATRRKGRARRGSLEHVASAVVGLAKQPVRLAKQPVRLARYTTKKVRRRVEKARHARGSDDDDDSFLNDRNQRVVTLPPLPLSPGDDHSNDDQSFLDDDFCVPEVEHRGSNAHAEGGSQRHEEHDLSYASRYGEHTGGELSPKGDHHRPSIKHAIGTLAKQPVKLAKQPYKLAKYTGKKIRKRIRRKNDDGSSISYDGAESADTGTFASQESLTYRPNRPDVQTTNIRPSRHAGQGHGNSALNSFMSDLLTEGRIPGQPGQPTQMEEPTKRNPSRGRSEGPEVREMGSHRPSRISQTRNRDSAHMVSMTGAVISSEELDLRDESPEPFDKPSLDYEKAIQAIRTKASRGSDGGDYGVGFADYSLDQDRLDKNSNVVLSERSGISLEMDPVDEYGEDTSGSLREASEEADSTGEPEQPNEAQEETSHHLVDPKTHVDDSLDESTGDHESVDFHTEGILAEYDGMDVEGSQNAVVLGDNDDINTTADTTTDSTTNVTDGAVVDGPTASVASPASGSEHAEQKDVEMIVKGSDADFEHAQLRDSKSPSIYDDLEYEPMGMEAQVAEQSTPGYYGELEYEPMDMGDRDTARYDDPAVRSFDTESENAPVDYWGVLEAPKSPDTPSTTCDDLGYEPMGTEDRVKAMLPGGDYTDEGANGFEQSHAVAEPAPEARPETLEADSVEENQHSSTLPVDELRGDDGPEIVPDTEKLGSSRLLVGDVNISPQTPSFDGPSDQRARSTRGSLRTTADEGISPPLPSYEFRPTDKFALAGTRLSTGDKDISPPAPRYDHRPAPVLPGVDPVETVSAPVPLVPRMLRRVSWTGAIDTFVQEESRTLPSTEYRPGASPVPADDTSDVPPAELKLDLADQVPVPMETPLPSVAPMSSRVSWTGAVDTFSFSQQQAAATSMPNTAVAE